MAVRDIYMYYQVGRPQIQRYVQQLVLALNVNDFGHMALFIKNVKLCIFETASFQACH